MDEPTGDLDINSRQMVWDAISEVRTHSHTSFLISTQHLEEAEYLSSEICIIKDGSIAALDTSYKFRMKQGYGLKINMNDYAKKSNLF